VPTPCDQGDDTVSTGCPQGGNTHPSSETVTDTETDTVTVTETVTEKNNNTGEISPNGDISSSQLDSYDEQNIPEEEKENSPTLVSKGSKDKSKNKTFSEDSQEYQLAKLLLDCIIEHRPNFKRPNLQSWAKHIDLMLRVDKRTPEEIEQVIRWCQKDPFWQVNILSTRKLREKFDQLALKMQMQRQRQFKTIRAGPVGKVSRITARNIQVVANWLGKTRTG